MVSTPMPANLRKRSEQYAKNIKHRGHVKKSLNPEVERRLEEERLRKKGLKSGRPTLGPSGRKVVLALLLITLGSALYQIVQPLISNFSGRSAGGTQKTEAELTREQQAKAAEAILKAMNQKAAEKYLKTAKHYKPPAAPANSNADAGDDDDEDEDIAAVPIPDTQEPLV
ncbi:hypothetical protein LPJ63_002448 [Coemansia sp. RSA 2711]|nr:hypothetical protein LPJ63_002448 [Coemansia sp. RSA 2711]KAJ1847898.1 hypothetical protein LPJ70_001299 [Coemansia sp. RSA 2708]KAJ2302899.1 hypothetical protein IWW54_005896 [Coemansia sp. RSA 2705]KAJ2303495.1 hypothetical protein IWW52_006784 [Coemansia sp. RSA 2704]KAJ2311789.1 hypothetical protein IWW51_006372 [Coemansia sp. RSA 2702]KAJ2368508.1 hypothetical protein H4S01_001550 [Coemansia sp. RSA 2610]KAJ2392141.1 hypothetical protein H4S02_000948 [Coemansia sp. RSA 2611]KAJ270990